MRISIPSKSISARLRRSLLITCLLASPAFGQDATVGAFYYPWWSETHPRGHSYADTHRAVLDPQGGDPIIGRYDSRDLWTIASHIDQSQSANISVWFNSWWGPNSFENDVLRNYILTHPHAGRMKQAVLYESTSRLGDFDNPNWSNFRTDLDYLAHNVLKDDNYFTIDNKPAVFVYVSRAYANNSNNADLTDQLDAARAEIKANHDLDLYLIGDHIFGSVADQANAFDAVSAYDVYGQTHRPKGGTFTGTAEEFAQVYANALAQGDLEGFDVIPTVSPGYNDRQTRPENDNPAAPRYYEDLHTTTIGDPFRDMINVSALPHTDEDVDHLILVNSFNETHEDTQIEAIKPSQGTLRDITEDNDYTQLKYYEGYGTRYLDILRQNTGGPQNYAIFNGIVGDGDQDGQLTTDDIVALGQHWNQNSSELTLREIAQHGDWDLDGATDLQDLELLVGYLNDDGIGISLEEAWTLISVSSGDYNLNGTVDAADYTVWQDRFGSTTAMNADGNGNGVIDAADYTVWQDRFGTSLSGGPNASITIPEPGTATVMVSLVLGLRRRRTGRLPATTHRA